MRGLGPLSRPPTGLLKKVKLSDYKLDCRCSDPTTDTAPLGQQETLSAVNCMVGDYSESLHTSRVFGGVSFQCE